MSDMIRTFVAVEASEAVRRRAEELIDALRVAGADVKWVERQNMHLTLKFLGDVPSRDIPEVCRAVQSAVAAAQPLELHLRGAGAFPSAGRPRTVWLGAAEGEEELAAVQHQVDLALRKLGHPKEDRRFEPHLTLGRVRGGGSTIAELGRLLKQHAAFDAGHFQIAEAIVFSSRLTAKGPIYAALCRAELSGGTRHA
jgi:RNA 2',3'-cyclic 3'-phosphodiesterase